LLLFAVLHLFCQYFDPFEIKIGAADISALFKTKKAPKKWQKRCDKGKRSNFFGTGLNLALGATFSPDS